MPIQRFINHFRRETPGRFLLELDDVRRAGSAHTGDEKVDDTYDEPTPGSIASRRITSNGPLGQRSRVDAVAT